MNENLEKFMKKEKAYFEVFSHREEIYTLKHNGYTLAQIQKFLIETYGIRAHHTTITKIIKEEKNGEKK